MDSKEEIAVAITSVGIVTFVLRLMNLGQRSKVLTRRIDNVGCFNHWRVYYYDLCAATDG